MWAGKRALLIADYFDWVDYLRLVADVGHQSNVTSQSDKLANKLAGKIPAGNEHLPLFNSTAEVDFALAEGAIKYHTRIRFRNPYRPGRESGAWT